MDRFAMIAAFVAGHIVPLTGVTPNGMMTTLHGVISSLEREDGSGYSYNVMLDTPNGRVSMYVRFPR